MTPTDELRAMLDERGVEWETDRSGFRVMWGKPVDEFHDTMQFKAVDNALPNGGLNVHICGFTPEQAIAATLGAGTCHEVMIDKFFRGCSECGYMWEYMYGIGNRSGPNFCPKCGARVVRA